MVFGFGTRILFAGGPGKLKGEPISIITSSLASDTNNVSFGWGIFILIPSFSKFLYRGSTIDIISF